MIYRISKRNPRDENALTWHTDSQKREVITGEAGLNKKLDLTNKYKPNEGPFFRKDVVRGYLLDVDAQGYKKFIKKSEVQCACHIFKKNCQNEDILEIYGMLAKLDMVTS